MFLLKFMYDYFKDLKNIANRIKNLQLQSGSKFNLCFLRKLCCVVSLRHVKSILRLLEVIVSVIVEGSLKPGDRKVV